MIIFTNGIVCIATKITKLYCRLLNELFHFIMTKMVIWIGKTQVQIIEKVTCIKLLATITLGLYPVLFQLQHQCRYLILERVNLVWYLNFTWAAYFQWQNSIIAFSAQILDNHQKNIIDLIRKSLMFWCMNIATHFFPTRVSLVSFVINITTSDIASRVLL